MEYLASFARNGLAPDPENNAGWIGFRQERVAMVIDGVYMLGDLKRLDGLEYFGAPIPALGPNPGAHADSHTLCIRKGITPEQRAAVVRFIKFLSDHSIEWAGAGQVPARRSARATDEFKALPVQYEFSKQIPNLRYPPKTVVLFEFQIEVDLAVEKVLRNRTTAAEALRVARENVQRFMDREGFGQ
jgi:multiple sugar transport system substrate-binding protein